MEKPKHISSVAACMLQEASRQLAMSSHHAATANYEQARLCRNVADALVRQLLLDDRNAKRTR
jgi:hypothetical protein